MAAFVNAPARCLQSHQHAHQCPKCWRPRCIEQDLLGQNLLQGTEYQAKGWIMQLGQQRKASH